MSEIIKIERLNHNGEGIGKLNNITTFIPKTIPNDQVEINIIENHKNFNRASVIKYIKRDCNCVNPSCQYYYNCGGCHISNLSYEEQLEYKKNKAKEIFKKYLNIDIRLNIIPSKNVLKYRNKITLQINKGKIGLYAPRTNNIVEVNKCLLVSDNLNEIINKLRSLDLSKINNIVLRESNDEILLSIYGEISKDDLKKIDKVNTIIYNSQIIKGRGYIVQNIKYLKFKVSAESFFQVNNEMVVKLYDKVLEYSKINKDDILIDLYCGTGTIGIYLARYCKKVLGIEINKSSIKDANKNKKINNINNIEFICGDVSKIINNKYQASIIVIDPPRSGLDKKTRKTLLEILPKKIVYVSCDTMTLARDLKELLEKYEIENCTLMDMFPQTYHVECVCLLKLR